MVVYTIALIGAMPAIIAAIYSVRRTSGPVFHPGFGLESYRRILYNLADVVQNSLMFSFATVALIVTIGTLIGCLVARKMSFNNSLLDATLMVPYVMPGIVVGIAFVAAFNSPPARADRHRGRDHSVDLHPAASLFSPLLGLCPATGESRVWRRRRSPSATVPLRAFMKVTVPLILPGIIAGGMLSFVTAINELSSSLVLYVGSTATMPVRIYIAINDGDYGTAAALSTVLLVLSSTAIYIAFRLMGRDERALL